MSSASTTKPVAPSGNLSLPHEPSANAKSLRSSLEADVPSGALQITKSGPLRVIGLPGASPLELSCSQCNQRYTTTVAAINDKLRKDPARIFCGKSCSLQNQHEANRRTCPQCGTVFVKNSVKYCTTACAEKGRSALRMYPCSHCGKDFEKLRYDAEKSSRKGRPMYCSPSCTKAGIAQTLQVNFCECGNPMPRSRKVTCSDACLSARRALTHKQVPCQHCGAVFRPSSTRRMYCSVDCANRAHSHRMVGKANPHYKSGTSYAGWFKAMRPLILERDGHRCVVCRACPPPLQYRRKGKPAQKSRLAIHHINEQPWDNRAENLITLCSTCHATHHKSASTPYPWFGQAARVANLSMTFRWQRTVTSLLERYSSTTASS